MSKTPPKIVRQPSDRRRHRSIESTLSSSDEKLNELTGKINESSSSVRRTQRSNNGSRRRHSCSTEKRFSHGTKDPVLSVAVNQNVKFADAESTTVNQSNGKENPSNGGELTTSISPSLAASSVSGQCSPSAEFSEHLNRLTLTTVPPSSTASIETPASSSFINNTAHQQQQTQSATVLLRTQPSSQQQQPSFSVSSQSNSAWRSFASISHSTTKRRFSPYPSKPPKSSTHSHLSSPNHDFRFRDSVSSSLRSREKRQQHQRSRSASPSLMSQQSVDSYGPANMAELDQLRHLNAELSKNLSFGEAATSSGIGSIGGATSHTSAKPGNKRRVVRTQQTCSMQHNKQTASSSDDVTVNELAAYIDDFLHLPRKMSFMAENMYA